MPGAQGGCLVFRDGEGKVSLAYSSDSWTTVTEAAE